MASKWGLKEKLASLQKMKSTLPTVLGNKIKNFTMDAFRKQGWTDTSFERWKPIKRNKDAGRAILVKRGKLKRSIKVRMANWTRVVVGSYGIEYAQIHNEGGSISKGASSTVLAFKSFSKGKNKGKTRFAKNNAKASYAQKVGIGAHSINMPKRQFIGKSQRLERELKGIIGGEFLRVLKK
jgi:phage gpG-like protein